MFKKCRIFLALQIAIVYFDKNFGKNLTVSHLVKPVGKAEFATINAFRYSIDEIDDRFFEISQDSSFNFEAH